MISWNGIAGFFIFEPNLIIQRILHEITGDVIHNKD